MTLGWTDRITQGIESALHSKDQDIELYFEYMDTKRIHDAHYSQKLYELYRHKFRNRRFDVIISSDDHAFNFLLAHHQELFPDSPVVFCGVNDFKDSMLVGHNLITGVVESFDIKGSIDVAFEESTKELIRNTRSIGIDLEPWIKNGSLKLHSQRATSLGLDMHLVEVFKIIEEFEPNHVVLDPISALVLLGTDFEVKLMITGLVDYLKKNQITCLLTDLTPGSSVQETTTGFISSLIDAWIVLFNIEGIGERNRGLYIVKSRGMAHSNQVREFLITDNGVNLTDVYVGPEGMFVGSARLTQEAREKAARMARLEEIERKQRALELKRKAVERQIESMREELKAEEEDMKKNSDSEALRERALRNNRVAMGKLRGIDNQELGSKETPGPEKD